MTRHVVRPTRAGWRCSCGVLFTADAAALDHAHSNAGRVEMGRRTA